VLLLSGTAEGPALAHRLLESGFAVHATVTRPQACDDLFGDLQGRPGFTVEARGFTEAELTGWLKTNQPAVVLDATHPFAARITTLARHACTQVDAAYIRYERPAPELPEEAVAVDSFEPARHALAGMPGPVLLTIGAKQLKHFAPLHQTHRLIARILPSTDSIQQAGEAGFSQKQLLALRPPFSKDLERALLAHCRAAVLVTKASADSEAMAAKLEAAREMNVRPLVVRRPLSPPPGACDTFDAAVAACLTAAGVT
jgi:precorrin-6A/cobalt-precorrin-6A reductase